MRKSLPLLIIGLCLAVRLGYLAYVNEHPQDGQLFAPVCGIDAHIYDAYARSGLAGDWPGSEPLDRTPLYTLFLLTIYNLFGVNHYGPLIFQSFLHTLTAATLYSVGHLTFSRTAGYLAASGFALYGSLIFYTGCFAQVSLVVPLITLTLFFLLKFRQQAQMIYLLAAGGTVALATLARPTILILMPVALLWLFIRRNQVRHWVGATVGFVVITFLILAPATLFNYSVSHRFILISTNGPEVLFISNNLEAEGRDILAPGIVLPSHRRLETVSAAIKRGETTFTREVVTYIFQEPLDWLALQGNKLWLLFGKTDLNILSIAFAFPTTPSQLTIFTVMPVVQWHGLIVAAILGMILVKHPEKLLLLLTFGAITLATIIFFIQLRFRLLLTPVVILYAAALLARAPTWFVSERRKFYVALVVLLLSMLAMVDVWPFALALVSVALWQSLKNGYGSRWAAACAWSLFVLIFLSNRIIASNWRMGQPEDYYLGQEIVGPIFLGQTLQPDCPGLNRLQFTLGIPTPIADQTVIFHLQSRRTGQEVFSKSFSTTGLTDRTVKTFTFPPQPDSDHTTYLAYFTVPEAQPGHSITLRGFSDVPLDGYPAGQAVVGQGEQIQPFPGDLAFAAFCQTTWFGKIDRAFAGLPGSKEIYWLLFIGHIGLLIGGVFAWWRERYAS